jgi:methylenetetrahydrofolate reductase (NADPH)
LFIRDFYQRREPTISFEYFPPKDQAAEETLLRETTPALMRLGASFISVTYGAGGSTRGTTFRVVNQIRQAYGLEAVAHLTCVGSTRAALEGVLDEAERLGIQNLLCLRGDPPKGETEFKPVEGGFAYAVDLMRFVKQARGDSFCIGGACYPEGHIECTDKILDWNRAADKVEAGAEVLITQLFYDWNDFLAFEDYLRNKRGAKVPIIPGVLPFLSTGQIRRFTRLCGASLSKGLQARLEQYASDDESARQLGVEVCTDICRKALDHGVKGIHFYCLNRVTSVSEVMHNLGLAKEDGLQAAG